ncbi:hypothetical protein [Pseudomonas fontis]|uniref:N-acetylglucosamine binding protein A domain-containing protein n=1 Tax=Pseudomonas fontis TaxID=2942633 RepID=A0ABT5NZ42_9PSED|nr:hypothetical protein [Pseudomonas fontis]MDD0977564.1 hypothetical protein [Pseudomonas fontis]MDD0993458.1 hypothetical protein [Pseudomonas fontis]
MATTATQASTNTSQVAPFVPSDMGFVLSNEADKALPDTSAFTRQTLGTLEHGWLSPGEIVAERDLVEGETLVACLVRQHDGVMEQVTFTATADNCSQAKWPKAFAAAVKTGGKALVLGNFDKDNAFKTDASALPLRLWHYSARNRAFTTAPFAANQVQALVITGETLEADTQLCIQVRDITSQSLYENHFFSVDNARLSLAQWSEDLCKALNQDSKLLRAGVKGTDGTITPGSASNALWIPQDSDLSVTLSVAAWVNQGELKASAEMGENESVQLAVQDAFSGKVLETALSFVPADESERAKDAWLSGLATKLKASALAPYVRLGSAATAGSDTLEANAEVATLWVRGDALTVVAKGPAVQSVDTSKKADPEPEVAHWVFRLSAEANKAGIRVESFGDNFGQRVTADGVVCTAKSESVPADQLNFYYPPATCNNKKMTLGHWGKVRSSRASSAVDELIWSDCTAVECTTPKPQAPYVAKSPLCEDFGNTSHSEVCDAGAATETGVDPRTGLFHAHYPVVTLQGLDGDGPVCDLTMHYSALRGNEAALGDGWAFRFASLEPRDRCLTLADGTVIQFTDEEWTKLGNAECLKKKGCWVTGNSDWSEFILDLPSGRREYLSSPSVPGGDTVEPNDKLRQDVISLLNQIIDKTKPLPPRPTGFWDWLLVIANPILYFVAQELDWNAALKKWRES